MVFAFASGLVPGFGNDNIALLILNALLEERVSRLNQAKTFWNASFSRAISISLVFACIRALSGSHGIIFVRNQP